MNLKRTFLTTLACANFILALSSPALAATYTVTDLGTFGGTLSRGYGINASGQVTGFARTTGNALSRVFVRRHDARSGNLRWNNSSDAASTPAARSQVTPT